MSDLGEDCNGDWVAERCGHPVLQAIMGSMAPVATVFPVVVLALHKWASSRKQGKKHAEEEGETALKPAGNVPMPIASSTPSARIEEVWDWPNAVKNPKEFEAFGAIDGDDHRGVSGEVVYRPFEQVTAIDPRDVGTADDWIPRHPDLIRLTGRHPFNCEPPLPLLLEAGFITPASLHYVRNHGAPPKINWKQHRFTINGNVPHPRTFTMDQIVAMPSVRFPCTLVCAGNRRKEENMVKQTIGFNWGAAGVSNSIWTGVPLRDLLALCGVTEVTAERQHVCFRGPKQELPKGPDGSYGTSITLGMALDPAADVILAYKQNDEILHPDHGFPVRLLIPGWIGGRSIKYIEELTVSAKPSDNYYHFMDNRILPPNIDAEKATAEGWWYHKEYLFNELNINSAIGSPAHNEVVPLKLSGERQSYRIKGYAYSGGGRRITRVEISLDGGLSWELANIWTHERPNAYMKYWCWFFFDYEVAISRLADCDEIMCRAYDEGNNSQPRHLTWNVMGMGNNCYFRVRVNKKLFRDGGEALHFEHPTLAGPSKEGWMGHIQGGLDGFDAKKFMIEEGARMAGIKLPSVAAETTPALVAAAEPAVATTAAPPAVAAESAATATTPGGARIISMSEVEKHNTPEDCWIVVAGKVYNPMPFLKDHPGGGDSITINAGMDATEDFEAVHSQKAWKMLEDYYIGDLEGATLVTKPAPVAAPAPAVVEEVKPKSLDPRKKIPFPLIEKIVINHNVRIFRFGLPSPEHEFGLPIGSHVFLSARIGDKPVMRAYTPTSQPTQKGHFDLMVKVYWKNEHPKFPDGGLMSQHLESMKIGDTIDIKGPIGHVEYLGRGNFLIDKLPTFVKKVGMIAGGTGITPMYQLMMAVMADPEDTTELQLLYANQTPGDILLKDELDAAAAKFPGRVKVSYTVDRVPEGESWNGLKGFISEEMVRATLPVPEEGVICLLCGPPPMLNFACYPNLEKYGYDKETQCVAF
eukprot:jgi/Mesvir1/14508/Mv05207-RA.1